MEKFHSFYFYDDYLKIKKIFKDKIIKYEEIDKIYYTKWSFKNFILNAFSKYNFPGRLNIVIKANGSRIFYGNKIYYVSFKYKDLDKLPKYLKYKLIIKS